jgi:tetratricopeptide (TPR) repeat protein
LSKISITPIGTCRINTPLRRGAARYPIALNVERIYGFVHTTEEALQQLEFLVGERSFDKDVLPILFRPTGDEDLTQSVWTTSDIHIVEVSSSKSYRVGNTAVQSNYLTRYFADFFASVPRTRRFWSLASGTDRASRTELAAFLKADPVYTLYSKRDQALLSSISMRMQNFDEILRDMGAIVERLGAGRVLFVTHVNAMSPDGAVIPSRDKVIRWIKLAAERLGVPCFDPTAMMREFGQDRAMERDGLDTTHFTNTFSDRWYTHVHREYVLPRIVEAGLDAEPGEAASPSLMAESIAAAIEFDDFFEGTRQLFAALKDHPDNSSLRQLAGQVYHRLGDFRNVAQALGPIAESPDMTVPSLINLMRASYEAGDAVKAVEIADRLLADEYETIEVYEIAGLAAERLGRQDDAVRYGKLAFRLDQSQHRFATRVLDHYIASDEADKFDNWHSEIGDRLAANPDVAMARALAEWSIVRRDEAMFRSAIMVVARGEMRSAVRLVEEAVSQGMLTAAAEMIVAIAALPNVDGNVMRNFRVVAEKWAGTCDALLAEGRIGDAFALATACQTVLPKNKDARRIERNVVLHLRDKIRAAQAVGDHEAVIAMGEAAGRMLYRRYEIAAAYARSLLASGRGREALDIAQQGCAAFPENIDLRGLSAQIAASLGDVAMGLQLYGDLRLSTEPSAERYRARGDRFFEKIERTGPRLVRALVASGEYEQAISLAALITTHTAAQERISVELLKLRRVLRARLRELDEEEDTGREPMRVLQLMLAIMPNEASTLRRAALESMKLQDFEAAQGYWRELDRVSPGLPSTAHNIKRCEIYAQRQAARANSVRTALAA